MNLRRGSLTAMSEFVRRGMWASAVVTVGASLVLGSVTAPAANAVDTAFNPGSRPGDATEVAAVIAAVGAQLADTAGAAIAIVKPAPGNPSASVTTTYYFGEANKAQSVLVGPQTQFEIGSQTKTFTAALLALRVRSGAVTLDDLAQSRLPASAELTLPGADGESITMGELVTHRSGLKRDATNLGQGCLAEMNYDITKLTAGLNDNFGALIHTPGTDWLYSNWGFGLLGSIVSGAFEPGARAPYGDAVTRELTGPLGMSATELEPRSNSLLAVPYQDGNPVCPHNNTESYAGAGGLVSTVEDMAVWAEATMGRGGNPLASTLNTTLNPVAPGTAGTNMQMGMAWQLYPPSPTEPHAHAYKDGTTGGSQSVTELVPSTGWAVTVLTNEHSANPTAVANQLRKKLASRDQSPTGSSVTGSSAR